MLTLRCTRKFLTRMRMTPIAEVSPATTVLGDWYATVLNTHPHQLVLCLSARSLLAVLIPLRNSAHLDERMRIAVRRVLEYIGISEAHIEREISEMADVGFAGTADRRLLGCLKSAEQLVMWTDPESFFPEEIENKLTKYLYSTVGYTYPRDLARALFNGAA